MRTAAQEAKERMHEEEENPGRGQEFWDDVSGEKLDPELVRKARAEEMKEFAKHKVYRKVPLEECLERTGKMPI